MKRIFSELIPVRFRLALLHRGNDLLAVLAEVAQFIEFGVVSGADNARIRRDGGRLIGDGLLEPLAHIGQFVNLAVEVAE